MHKRTLLIDDDPGFRALLKPLLEASEFEVVEASCGDQANMILAHRNFDLLIVNAVLPDSQGIDLIASWRSSSIATPIVFLSSSPTGREILSRLVNDLSVCLVVQKPMSPTAFVHQIGNVLRQPPTAKWSAKQSATLAKLSAAYKKEIPRLLTEIVQAIQEARSSNGGEPSLGQAVMLAHRMSGTSGSYGYIELSNILTDIERRLRNVCYPIDRDNFIWSDLEGMLASARSYCDE